MPKAMLYDVASLPAVQVSDGIGEYATPDAPSAGFGFVGRTRKRNVPQLESNCIASSLLGGCRKRVLHDRHADIAPKDVDPRTGDNLQYVGPRWQIRRIHLPFEERHNPATLDRFVRDRALDTHAGRGRSRPAAGAPLVVAGRPCR